LRVLSKATFLFEVVRMFLFTYGKTDAIRLKIRFKGSTLLRPLLVSISDIDNIHISKKVFIHAGLVLRVLGDCQLYIGEDTYIGPNTHISGTQGIIIIGKKVMIADNVLVSTAAHRYQDVMVPIKDQGYESKGNITICDGSWIGEGSIIMSGVRVGKNSVVGANSVVTRDVPPFSVAAGCPARVIKQYNATQKKWSDILIR
jgi:acetyltransferase-like isoleucine patch superfamily enzyme